MTSIERTAYPRFKKTLTQAELDEFYTPTEEEINFVNKAAAGQSQQLSLAILLKSFQKRISLTWPSNSWLWSALSCRDTAR